MECVLPGTGNVQTQERFVCLQSAAGPAPILDIRCGNGVLAVRFAAVARDAHYFIQHGAENHA
jgi:hypothetical protein